MDNQLALNLSRNRTARFIFCGLLGVFIVAGSIVSFQTNIFNAPDERGHVYAISTIMNTGRLPVFSTTQRITNEAHQPPLYYLIATPVSALMRAYSEHARVIALRLFSLLISAGVPIVAYSLARRLFPSRPTLALATMAIVALNPQFIFMSSVVNNDSLANLLGSLGLLALAHTCLDQRLTRRQLVFNGALIAGLAMTKVSVWPIAGLLALAMLIRGGRGQFKAVLAAGLPTAALLAWWLLRNYHLYGDATLIRTLKLAWYQEQHRDFLSLAGLRRWLATTVESFWARFAYFNIALRPLNYKILKFGSLFAVIGIFREFFLYRKQLDGRRWLLIGLFISAFICLFLGFFAYSLNFYQPQGRYFFPIISLLGLAGALGLESLVPKKLRGVLLGLIIIIMLLIDLQSLRLIVRYA